MVPKLGEDHREASGFPAEGTVFPLRGVDIRIVPGPHPLYVQHQAAIEENWAREVAANPSLYNGRLVFLRRLALNDGRLLAEGHLVPYATHLWWRKQKDRFGGYHACAWAVPLSSDGAVIAIRMGKHTANPGLVYCAAGSLEAEDVFADRVDITANMLRELREETGLDVSEARSDALLHGLIVERSLLLFRVYRFDRDARSLILDIDRHMRGDHEQEIEEALAIRSADPEAHVYSGLMRGLLSHVFRPD